MIIYLRAKKEGYVKGDRFKDTARLEAIEGKVKFVRFLNEIGTFFVFFSVLAIKLGESLISLSKKFNIPISTLHREKLKLYEKGQLPENVNFKVRSRGCDYETRLRSAIRYV